MAKNQKLNQVIAVEKGVKARTLSEVSELYKIAQKPQLFEGLSRTYLSAMEGGENFPSEATRVQYNAKDLVRQVSNRLSELLDVTLTKDTANTIAKADLVVDEAILAKDVPATTLLALEKQLTDVYTFVKSLPTLDAAKEWKLDHNQGLHKTDPVQTAKTKKVQKALILLQPTKEHQGQAVQVTDDQVIGNWNTVHQSGALTVPEKTALVQKVEKLQKAVKVAREEANLAEATPLAIGEKLFAWLFA